MNGNVIFSIYFILFAGMFILAGREVSLLINVFGIMAIGFAGTVLALSPSLAISLKQKKLRGGRLDVIS